MRCPFEVEPIRKHIIDGMTSVLDLLLHSEERASKSMDLLRKIKGKTLLFHHIEVFAVFCHLSVHCHAHGSFCKRKLLKIDTHLMKYTN